MNIRSRTYQTLASLMVGVFCAMSAVPIVFAEEMSSTNFILKDTSFSAFAGDSTSTSFGVFQGGGQTNQVEATSSNFVLNGDPLFYDAFSPRSGVWRWYGDDNHETPTSPLAGETVAPTGIASNDVIKLRLAIHEVGGVGSSNAKFRVQYATSSDFSDPHFLAEVGDCTTSDPWCYGDGTDSDGDIISTSVLTGVAECISGIGDGCGSHNESGITESSLSHKKNVTTEYEFTIKQSNAAANTVYFFRAFDVQSSSSVALDIGAAYPSVSTYGAELAFNIVGLPATTLTENVTTDVDTSSTVVPFGTLPLGTARAAAHRLTVSTNAAGGYRVFVYQRQGLVGLDEIDPVTSTNAVPTGWNTACGTDAAGCIGYHSGEDVLSGGNTTRFSAPDTYASFTSTPTEVAYSATPVNDKTTDMVYRVQVRSTQEAGEYSTDLVYVVTPIF